MGQHSRGGIARAVVASLWLSACADDGDPKGTRSALEAEAEVSVSASAGSSGVSATVDARVTVDPGLDASVPDASIPRCGDGVRGRLAFHEGCDDGNEEPGDACDRCVPRLAALGPPDAYGAAHTNAAIGRSGSGRLLFVYDHSWRGLEAVRLNAGGAPDPFPGGAIALPFAWDVAVVGVADGWLVRGGATLVKISEAGEVGTPIAVGSSGLPSDVAMIPYGAGALIVREGNTGMILDEDGTVVATVAVSSMPGRNTAIAGGDGRWIASWLTYTEADFDWETWTYRAQWWARRFDGTTAVDPAPLHVAEIRHAMNVGHLGLPVPTGSACAVTGGDFILARSQQVGAFPGMDDLSVHRVTITGHVVPEAHFWPADGSLLTAQHPVVAGLPTTGYLLAYQRHPNGVQVHRSPDAVTMPELALLQAELAATPMGEYPSLSPTGDVLWLATSVYGFGLPLD